MKKIFLGLALLLVSAALFLFFVTERLFDRTQLPSGQYVVGVVSKCLAPAESVSNLRDCAMMVNIFYPTDSATHVVHQYPEMYRAEWAKFRSQKSIIPQFVWRRIIDQLPTFADEHAQPVESDNGLPIIIFLPGIGGDGFYRTYLEDLASHGYVVVEIQPPHDVPVVLFDDGEVALLNPEFERAMNAGDRDQIYAYRTKAHYRWLTYIECAIGSVESANRNPRSPFFKRLDLERIALLGHSHGGAVVIDYCSQSDRSKAGVNMDGWTKTTNSIKGFATPFMFIENEGGAHEQVAELYRNMPEATERFLIPGAGHMAFSDYILLQKPFSYILGVASGDSQRIQKTIKTHLVEFFNKNVKSAHPK